MSIAFLIAFPTSKVTQLPRANPPPRFNPDRDVEPISARQSGSDVLQQLFLEAQDRCTPRVAGYPLVCRKSPFFMGKSQLFMGKSPLFILENHIFSWGNHHVSWESHHVSWENHNFSSDNHHVPWENQP